MESKDRSTGRTRATWASPGVRGGDGRSFLVCPRLVGRNVGRCILVGKDHITAEGGLDCVMRRVWGETKRWPTRSRIEMTLSRLERAFSRLGLGSAKSISASSTSSFAKVLRTPHSQYPHAAYSSASTFFKNLRGYRIQFYLCFSVFSCTLEHTLTRGVAPTSFPVWCSSEPIFPANQETGART